MLYMWSGDVKEGRMREMQAWIKKNEDLTQKYAPPGWTYKGTYAYVLGFGRYHVAALWECSTYGDFDVWREHADENWVNLNEEFMDFFENAPGEAVLLREIGDTKILERSKLEG